MGPEVIVTALAYWGTGFLLVGLAIGSAFKSGRHVALAIAAVSVAAGLANGTFAPEGYQLQAALLAAGFIFIVAGGFAAIVHVIRKSIHV